MSTDWGRLTLASEWTVIDDPAKIRRHFGCGPVLARFHGTGPSIHVRVLGADYFRPPVRGSSRSSKFPSIGLLGSFDDLGRWSGGRTERHDDPHIARSIPAGVSAETGCPQRWSSWVQGVVATPCGVLSWQIQAGRERHGRWNVRVTMTAARGDRPRRAGSVDRQRPPVLSAGLRTGAGAASRPLLPLLPRPTGAERAAESAERPLEATGDAVTLCPTFTAEAGS
jgi:hypothetical protein